MAAKKSSFLWPLLFVLLVAAGILLALPWGCYYYGLSFLDTLPEAPAKTAHLSLPPGLEAQERALMKADLAQNRFEAVTPYWIYRPALAALADEFLQAPLPDSFLKGSLSPLSGRAAIAYTGGGHYRQGQGLARRQLVDWSLAIWIQRHLTPRQSLALWRQQAPGMF